MTQGGTDMATHTTPRPPGPPRQAPGRDGGTPDQATQVGDQGQHVTAVGGAEQGQGLGGWIEVPGLHQGAPQPDHGGTDGLQIGTRPAHPDRNPQLEGDFGARRLTKAELDQATQDLRHELRMLGPEIIP